MSKRYFKRLNGFTPLEKATDEIGGRNRKNSLTGFTILKNKPVATELVINRLDEKTLFDKRVEAKLIKLKEIYRKVPKTKCTCSHPGEPCCSYYVVSPIYSIEYLNILRHIKEKFTSEEISKFYAFAKVNLGMEQKYRSGNVKRPKKWRPCIFMDEQNKTCKIYEYRPSTCRLYGINYSNKKKAKLPCSKVTLLDKKDKKLLNPTIVESMWREIRELSDYFISTSKQGTLITKSQRLNSWFLI